MRLKSRLLHLTRALHTYLSMLALIIVMFFALTGFLMNHHEWFNVEGTTVSSRKSTVPVEMLRPDEAPPAPGTPSATERLAKHLLANCGVKGTPDMSFTLDDDPVRITFKSPRFRDDVEIDKADGTVTIAEARATVAGYLASLHKGAETGQAWHRVIDATAILLALISITGLILWTTLAKRRTIGLISLGVCAALCVAVLLLFVP